MLPSSLRKRRICPRFRRTRFGAVCLRASWSGRFWHRPSHWAENRLIRFVICVHNMVLTQFIHYYVATSCPPHIWVIWLSFFMRTVMCMRRKTGSFFWPLLKFVEWRNVRILLSFHSIYQVIVNSSSLGVGFACSTVEQRMESPTLLDYVNSPGYSSIISRKTCGIAK